MMLRSFSLVASLLVPSMASSSSSSSSYSDHDIPDFSQGNWYSLTTEEGRQQGSEFWIPHDDSSSNHRQLVSSLTGPMSAQAHERYQAFADGTETLWSEYAQAWRYLGFYIDCYGEEYGYDADERRRRSRKHKKKRRKHKRRHLEDYNNADDYYQNDDDAAAANAADDDGYSDDDDAAAYEYNQYNYNQNQQDEEEDEEEELGGGCLRYLLWAAYVDPHYNGGGLGEYQIWDTDTKTWDRSACKTNPGRRCAKMDCHLPGSSWKLLGLFKQPNYAEWMEQLFKHQSYCMWDIYEYNFMQAHREFWPEYCMHVGTDEMSNNLYVDLRPGAQGAMELGFYRDQRCSQDYTGQKTSARIIKQYYGVSEKNINKQGGGKYSDDDHYDDDEGGENWDLDEDEGLLSLVLNNERWNQNMERYRACQPCKAYDLSNAYRYANGNEDENEERNEGQGDYYSSQPNNGNFVCYDAAGYTDVNQCYKFYSKTTMLPATLQDLWTATRQGSIPTTRVGSMTFQPSTTDARIVSDIISDTTFMVGGIGIFVLGFYMLYRSVTNDKRAFFKAFQEPLISTAVAA